MTPSTRPPIIAPGTLPRPPSTQTTKALPGRYAIERRDREDDAKQRAGRASHQRADTEGDGVDALDVNSHEGSRVTVHAHGDDGAADPAVAQQPVQHEGEKERERHGRDPVAQQDTGPI